MSAQPEALRLADEFRPSMPNDVMRVWGIESCAELRRLHEVNAELLEALQDAAEVLEIASAGGGVDFYAYAKTARATIAKAEGEME